VSDADGYCSADESRFKNAKGRQKIENDLRATATTRAKNRAISDLVGMGEVSAEEVEVAGGGPSMPEADEKQRGVLSAALVWLFDGDEEAAKEGYKIVTGYFDGSMPGPVANAVTALLLACKKRAEANGVVADPEPRQTPRCAVRQPEVKGARWGRAKPNRRPRIS
jgi:hypothetical protein